MKNFMDENFLLSTDTARKLFFDAAKSMPIFDFHNHLSAQEIYEDRQFESITQVWLGGDHYKWRMMRTFGYTQEQIVGDVTSDFEKFEMWAKTVEHLFGNPLYHWTHLELQRYFDIYEPLTSGNAKEIYDKCNELLHDNRFSVRNLLRQMNVYELCTTNPPMEDLKYHKLMAEDDALDFKVTPSFRPDFNLDSLGINENVSNLEKSTGINISSYDEYITAIKKRIDFFVENGCKITDHALDVLQFKKKHNLEDAPNIFQKAQKFEELNTDEIQTLYCATMVEVGKIYHELNLAQQYHIGAYRNSNTKMFNKYGPDVGFDFIEDWKISDPLTILLDKLDSTSQLPKTILYNLNPKDNDILVTLAGCFQDGLTRGKIQYGSAWWFLDNIKGMTNQIESLANNGMLSTFIGMLTDSRSFLSYPRHEYFRRILCNFIGDKVENGEFPNDINYLSSMVKDICFNNIKDYLERN